MDVLVLAVLTVVFTAILHSVAASITATMLNRDPVYIQEGSTLELRCSFKATTQIAGTEWKRGTTKLGAPEFDITHHVTFGPQVSGGLQMINKEKLIRQNIRADESGTYTCSLRNTAQSVQVKVVSFASTSDVYIAPGSDVVVSCKVGQVRASLKTTWTKDQTNLSAIPGLIQRITLSDNNTTMTIRHSNYSDVGVYTCHMNATNGEQQGEIRHDVGVVGKPYFVDGENNTETIEGYNGMELKCQPLSYPTADIRWHSLNGPIAGNDTRKIFDKTKTLKFLTFTRADYGIYWCVATNKYGSARKNFAILNMKYTSSSSSVHITTSFLLFTCLFTLAFDLC